MPTERIITQMLQQLKERSFLKPEADKPDDYFVYALMKQNDTVIFVIEYLTKELSLKTEEDTPIELIKFVNEFFFLFNKLRDSYDPEKNLFEQITSKFYLKLRNIVVNKHNLTYMPKIKCAYCGNMVKSRSCSQGHVCFSCLDQVGFM